VSIDWTNIVQSDIPPVDRTACTPSVDQVALLLRTRTVDNTGAEQGTFTSVTRPTDTEAAALIQQALEITLTDLPDWLPPSLYPRVQQAVALKAADLIEISFYREQYNQGAARAYTELYDLAIQSIQAQYGGAHGGRRVDSAMMRSTMAEYAPDYVPPPPRIIIRPPSIDGSPQDVPEEAG